MRGGGVALAGGGRGGHGGRRTGIVAAMKKSKQNSLEFKFRKGPGHAFEARKCISMHVVCSGLISISPPPVLCGKIAEGKMATLLQAHFERVEHMYIPVDRGPREVLPVPEDEVDRVSPGRRRYVAGELCPPALHRHHGQAGGGGGGGGGPGYSGSGGPHICKK